MRRILGLALIGWVFLGGAMRASAQAKSAPQPLAVKLLSEEDSVVPGKTLHLGVQFTLQPGWHIYWTNPGDSGEPPKIEWKLPQNFIAGSIEWPYPERISSFSAIDYGYENNVLLIVPLHPPTDLKLAGDVRFAAEVKWIACREVCIPGKQHVDLALPVTRRAALVKAQIFRQTEEHLPLPMPAEWKAQAISANDQFVLFIHTGEPVKSATFFPLHPQQIEDAAPQQVSATKDGVRIRLKKSDQLQDKLVSLNGVAVLADGKAYWVKAQVEPAIHSVSH